MDRSYDLSRRDFLKLATRSLLWLAGLLGLGGLVRYFGYRPDPGPPSEFDLGPDGDYPPGSRTLRPEIPALIVNRGGEFIALSLTCPHLGCTVEPGSEGFACPCHGSRFDLDGRRLAGPAPAGLRRLRVEVGADEVLRVFTDGTE